MDWTFGGSWPYEPKGCDGEDGGMHYVDEGPRAGRPVFIAWAMKDIAFTPDLLERLWLRTFPHAQGLRLEDAGHYLREDAQERIVPALLEFLRGN